MSDDKPLVLSDPTPRTLDLMFTPDDLAELKSIASLVHHEETRMPDDMVDRHLPDTTFVMGQTDLPRERLERAGKLKAVFNVEGNFRQNIDIESLGVLLLLAVIMAVLSPYFLSVSNFLNILLATATIGVLAIGATYVISSVGLDLSPGSVLGLSGVVGAWLVDRVEMPWIFGIVGCLLAGAVCGFINGLLVTRGRIPAFIVTLGMLGIARGLALIIAKGQAIYGLAPELVFLGQGRPFGVPMPAFVFLGVALIMHFVLAYTRFGRYTLVIGDNETAARAMGIKVESHKLSLYAISGLMGGIAGLLFMTRVNAGDPTAGLGYELTAITAAIIGGTNLFGGRGSILGTFIGALIMGVLQNGLNLLAVQSYYQQMAIGAVLIFAVWLDQSTRRRRER